MSNIFEIDGEIEDNNEDGNNENSGKKKKKEEQEQEDVNDSQESSTTDSTDDSDDDVPWYDKVLSGKNEDEEENTAEDESSSISFGTSEEAEEESQDDNTETETESAGSDDEDISEDEINEVLSELEDSEEALKEDEEELRELEETTKGQKNEPTNTESEEVEEEFDDIFPPRKKTPVSIATMVFAFLFLATLSLLSYYQFYDGEKFDFTFVHKSEDGPSKSQQLDSELQTELSENKELREQLSKMTEDFRAASAKLQKLQKEAEGAAGKPVSEDEDASESQDVQLSPLPQEGTFYQVQLMALKEYQPQFGASDFRFSVERDNGYTKYLVGPFKDESEVKTFYKKVRQSGFGDAFIVKKEEGERVPYNPFK